MGILKCFQPKPGTTTLFGQNQNFSILKILSAFFSLLHIILFFEVGIQPKYLAVIQGQIKFVASFVIQCHGYDIGGNFQISFYHFCFFIQKQCIIFRKNRDICHENHYLSQNVHKNVAIVQNISNHVLIFSDICRRPLPYSKALCLVFQPSLLIRFHAVMLHAICTHLNDFTYFAYQFFVTVHI